MMNLWRLLPLRCSPTVRQVWVDSAVVVSVAVCFRVGDIGASEFVILLTVVHVHIKSQM